MSQDASQMMGAQWLLKSAAAAGIEVCFANPGTTELPFVAAMDRATEIRPLLGLFEGVCSGAADGYYRIRRKPAMTLTHLGPGFANAIANLHNARRARSTIFNVIGEHMSWHVAADPRWPATLNRWPVRYRQVFGAPTRPPRCTAPRWVRCTGCSTSAGSTR